jgi:hypothetical protein
MAFAKPAQADFFHERRQDVRDSRHRDSDHDGIPNYRDRAPYSSRRTEYYRYYRDGRYYSTPDSGRYGDLDRDGIPNYRDRDSYSSRRTEYYRYYRDGRYYSTPRRGPNGDLDRDGIRNKNDRDRDGDGRRNKNDDHPSDRRRR